MTPLAVTLCTSLLLAAADVSRVMAESNLEKRSRLALTEASAALKSSRTAYEAGNFDDAGARLKDVAEFAELAHQSLIDTGKHPRSSPKHFKHAEIETRNLLRQLDAFEQAVSVADRDMVAPVRARVSAVNDALLHGLMEKKRK